MENATKALLIAASVLIAIVLIAVSIRVLSSTKGVTDQVDVLSGTLEASMYNSQFTKFVGENKNKSEAIELYKIIKVMYDRNSLKNDLVLNVFGNTIHYTNEGGDLSTLSNLLKDVGNVDITCTYDSQGFVNYIAVSIVST